MRANESRYSVFIAYAHEDESYKDVLLKWLVPMRRNGTITAWHDREILCGHQWEHEISRKLDESDIILLLVSIDFLSSEYINSVELKRAIERHDSGDALVIPILLRVCPWRDDQSLRGFQVLPHNAKPINDWNDKDKAYFDVIEGISKAVRESAFRLAKIRRRL